MQFQLILLAMLSKNCNNLGHTLPTDVKSRLAFTRPRCLAAYLELASVDFATVEVDFEPNRWRWGGNKPQLPPSLSCFLLCLSERLLWIVFSLSLPVSFAESSCYITPCSPHYSQ